MIPPYYFSFHSNYDKAIQNKNYLVSENLFESGLLDRNSNIKKETSINLITEKYIFKDCIQQKMRGFIFKKDRKIKVLGLKKTNL